MTRSAGTARDEPARRKGRGPGRLLVAALVALAGCSPSDRPADEPAAVAGTGRLVIVGGALADDTAPVWRAVIEGRDGAGSVCVIPTASSDPESSMRSAVATLDRYGGSGTAMGVLIAEGDVDVADDPAMGGTLLTCSGYWFTGGSQSRITETLLPGGEPTVALEAIRTRFAEGAVIAGTSAGAAIMSPLMISGGSSEEAFAEGVRDTPDGDGVSIRPGLGFFGAGVVDQHFLARGRIGRLLVAVLEHPEIDVGFGIDENTAMVVDGEVATVVGASGVVVVDGTGADPQSDRELVVWLAGTGDRIELGSRTVSPATDKTPVVGSSEPLPDAPILDRWVFLDALSAFSRRPEVGIVIEAVEGVIMTIEKGDGFFAVYGTEGEGVSTAPQGFSAGPFRLELAER